MRFPCRLLLCVAIASPVIAASVQPFNAGWRFLKRDAISAETPQSADFKWRALVLPHDWSVEGPFDEKNAAVQTGVGLPGGGLWYPKHFARPASDTLRRIFIDFDDAMANSEVWINGFHLDKRLCTDISFRYELTGRLNLRGEDDVLAVREDHSQQPNGSNIAVIRGTGAGKMAVCGSFAGLAAGSVTIEVVAK